MYVELCKNNGTDYLRLVSSRRVIDKNGKKTARKKTELNIGPLSRYDDGKPGYVERLKASFKEGRPLIPALLPFVSGQRGPEKHTVTFVDGAPDCIAHPKIVSHFLLDKVFQSLGLDTLCATLKHGLGLGFDLAGYLRLLLFGRILHPASKFATTLQNGDYSEALVSDADYRYHVYDVLDILDAHKEKFIRRMNSSITKSIGRNPKRIFYDVTNFFFETGEPDGEEEVDGHMEKGLRQKGVSKENRKEPIVQMGLFLDDRGIPITIETFPGNMLDHQTLRPAMKESLDSLAFDRYILVADRGMCFGPNLCGVRKDGHGYIVSKSIRKTAKQERKWILEPNGYIEKSPGFRYKSREYTRTVKDEDGKMQTLKEKVVVYWSKKFHDREYFQHKTFLEFIEKLRQSPSSFRITATQSKSVRKYFRKEFVNKKTGEIVDSKQLLGMLDEEKLEELTAYMGYYQIVTSELDMDAEAVIDTYHELTKIEDQFREMKGTLETRPIFVRTRGHIRAHLLLCMMALTMMRVLQLRIVQSGAVRRTDDAGWSYGMNGERLGRALARWRVIRLPDDRYMFCDTDDEDVAAILKAFGIKIKPRLYVRGELRMIKGNIDIF